MMRNIRLMLGLGMAVLTLSVAYGQGMYWESVQSKGDQGEMKSTAMSYAMPKMFKQVDAAEGRAVILRLDKEMMYALDMNKKTYQQMTFAELEAMVKQATGMMEEKLKALPPEQRKMMEERMGGMFGSGKPPVMDVNAAGEKKTINGFSCSKYVVKKDGKDDQIVWATKDVKEFDAMRKDWLEFTKRMQSMSPRAAGMAEAFKKIEGFPIQQEMGSMKTTVTKVEKRTIPAKEFEVPAGYTREESPKMGKEN